MTPQGFSEAEEEEEERSQRGGGGGWVMEKVDRRLWPCKKTFDTPWF
jgi:hypothetical protein